MFLQKVFEWKLANAAWRVQGLTAAITVCKESRGDEAAQLTRLLRNECVLNSWLCCVCVCVCV